MIRLGVASHQNLFARLRLVPLAATAIASAMAVSLTAIGQATAATRPRTAGQGDWAQFGFSASHTGFNPFEHVLSTANVSRLTKRWSVPLNNEGNVSSPVVVRGVLYIGSDFGIVYARTAATGHLLWTFGGAIGDLIISAPAVANGVVYVSGASQIFALNAATGHELWSFATPNNENSAPTVRSGVVYFGSGDGHVYALAAATGHKLWSFAASNFPPTSPAVANGVVYAGTFNGKVFALRAATGQKLWSVTVASSTTSVSGLAVANGVVYFGTFASTGPSAVFALNATTGAERWKFRVSEVILGTPAVANGLVYIGAEPGVSNGTFYALRAATGRPAWTFTDCCGFGASAALANGVVYLAAGDSTFYALDAATGRKLYAHGFAFDAGINDNPAVANGMVFFNTADSGQLYAFGLPKA